MKRKTVESKSSGDLSLKSSVKMTRERSLPFYEKYLLTVEEATVYYHIGSKKLTQLIKDNPKAKWILMNGKRTMIKKELFSMWLDQQSEI
ncbi:MAG: transposase [Lachnospiraceae bacterium]|nr:transposase [Lachnospiraceae bacterium]